MLNNICMFAVLHKMVWISCVVSSHHWVCLYSWFLDKELITINCFSYYLICRSDSLMFVVICIVLFLQREWNHRWNQKRSRTDSRSIIVFIIRKKKNTGLFALMKKYYFEWKFQLWNWFKKSLQCKQRQMFVQNSNGRDNSSVTPNCSREIDHHSFDQSSFIDVWKWHYYMRISYYRTKHNPLAQHFTPKEIFECVVIVSKVLIMI